MAIFQARILEWVAISFLWGSSQSRDQTLVSLIEDDTLLPEPPEKLHKYTLVNKKFKCKLPLFKTNILLKSQMYDNKKTYGINVSKVQSRKPWTYPPHPNKQKDSATIHGQILLRNSEIN